VRARRGTRLADYSTVSALADLQQGQLVVSHRPTFWGLTIVAVSLLFVAVTPLPYGLGGRGLLTEFLYWLGLGGERNVGAWWSGVLFLLAAILALDRFTEAWRPPTERRGWAALAAALAFLSFDEIAGLHEFLSARSQLYLVPVGLLGAGLVTYALVQLQRAKVPLHRLLLGFGLLATVPLQEFVQFTRDWPNAWVYGARALVEEGTEIAGALALLAATSGGLLRIRVGRESFASLLAHGTPLLWLAVAALPAVAVAVRGFNLPGAPNWLGMALFLACAALAVRGAAARSEPRLLWAAALYLLASLGANAVRPDWDPTVLGQSINLRGIYFGSLLLAAPWVLSPGEPWRTRGFWLASAGCTLLGAFVLPPIVIWSTWPPTVALLCFYVEISAAMRLRAVVAQAAPAASRPTAATGPQPAATAKVPTLAGPL
jgi:hypothetical protein